MDYGLRFGASLSWGEDALEWKPERWLKPLPRAVEDAWIPGIYSNTSVVSFLLEVISAAC